MSYVDTVRNYLRGNEQSGPRYQETFARYVELAPPNAVDECIFNCPFHDDDRRSASVNIGRGIKGGCWFCFNPDCQSKGDIFGFYAKMRGDDVGEMILENVARDIALELGIIEDITSAMVAKMHSRLVQDPELLGRATKMLGLTQETLAKFKVGWAEEVNTHYRWPATQRFAIPIKGPDGHYHDARLYNREMHVKTLPWKTGQGGPRPFPETVFRKSEHLFLVEGEKDCMRAHQCGIGIAATITAGAGSLPEDFDRLFKDKFVYICYDIDAAGKKGAESIAARISQIAKEVRIISLPTEGLPEKGDFSDYANLIGDDKVLSEIKKLIDVSPVASRRVTTTGNFNEGEPSPDDVEFDKILANNMEMHNRRIRFAAHTVGASVNMKSYLMTTEASVFCPHDMGRTCIGCQIHSVLPEDMPAIVPINPASEDALGLIRAGLISKKAVLKKVVGVPEKCTTCNIIESKRVNVQIQLLSQPVAMNMMRDQTTIHKLSYYHGPQIKDNADYYFTAYLQADPRSQESVLNIQSAERVNSVLDGFEITDSTRDAINYFKIKNNEHPSEHFDHIYEILETATGIYGRKDVIRCMLNSIYSALEFKIGNKTVENGWIECIIIGDTRTGKSEVAKKMMRMINVGEYIGGENVSAAGLIGGIQMVENMPIPVWGKWPQNDRGFIVFDEIGELNDEIMGRMSSMRSSGTAEIQKIQQARTSARVRCVMIANPDKGAKMASFDTGVKAIASIIRNAEDIARFTAATVVVDDLDIDTILRDEPQGLPTNVCKFFNELAMLTWSLTRENVLFDAATNLYLRSAVRQLSGKYHSSIPIWDKGSGLDKLARLCVPVAVLCGSFDVTDPAKPLLIITEEHARYAVRSLELLYDNPSMAYDKYSRQQFERERLVSEPAIIYTLITYYKGDRRAIVQFFLANDRLTIGGLTQMVGFRPDAERIWSELLINNAIVPSVRGYDFCVKTIAFVRLLEDLADEIKNAPAQPIDPVPDESDILNALS